MNDLEHDMDTARATSALAAIARRIKSANETLARNPDNSAAKAELEFLAGLAIKRGAA